MTHRHARDRSRLSRAKAERVLDGELSTAPIAALLIAATGPPRMREQASEFFVRSAYRAAETPTQPVPAARSPRHAAAAPPSIWGRVLAGAAALSRLLSPRMLVGAIAGAAAVGVVVAMYTGSLSQPSLPDTATVPAAQAPQPPGAQQSRPPEGVPAPVPAAPAAPDSAEQVAAGPNPPGPPAARAATRPGPAAVPAARSGGGSGGGSDSVAGSGGSRSGGSGGSGGSGSAASTASSGDSGDGASGGGGSRSGSLVEVNLLGIELSL